MYAKVYGKDSSFRSYMGPYRAQNTITMNVTMTDIADPNVYKSQHEVTVKEPSARNAEDTVWLSNHDINGIKEHVKEKFGAGKETLKEWVEAAMQAEQANPGISTEDLYARADAAMAKPKFSTRFLPGSKAYETLVTAEQNAIEPVITIEGSRFVNAIFNKDIKARKLEETRDSRTLDGFIGRRVGISKSGSGLVTGYVDIVGVNEYTEDTFHLPESETRHRVAKGDKYDIKPGEKKYGYILANPTVLDTPIHYDYDPHTGMRIFQDIGKQRYRFSTRTLSDGRKVAWVDENILASKPAGMRVIDFVQDYLLRKYSTNDLIDVVQKCGTQIHAEKAGRTIKSRYGLAEEYVGSSYSKWLLKSSRNILKAKMKAAGVLNDIVSIAKYARTEKTEHDYNKDAKFGVDYYKSTFAFPSVNRENEMANVNAYDCELVVLNASDGKKYLYDIVKVQKKYRRGHRPKSDRGAEAPQPGR